MPRFALRQPEDREGYVRVARVAEIPEGAGRTVEAAGLWLALFRVGGEVFAVDNACPHMAGPLGAGLLEGHVVTCPLHSWKIDVRTGRSPTHGHARVACYETKVDGEWVWVRRPRPGA